MGSFVCHDFPEALRASQGLGAELDAVLAANVAAQGSAETGVQHDSHVGERGCLPQRAEPAEDPLDAAGVGRSKSPGRSVHAGRC